MNNLGVILKQALVEKKQPDEVRQQLIQVLDSHITGFSAQFEEKLMQAHTHNQVLLDIKALAWEILITQQKSIEHFLQEFMQASQFVGLGDHAYPRYSSLYTRVQGDLDSIQIAFDEIRHQVELTKAFIDLQNTPLTNPVSSTKHTSFVLPVPPKKNTSRPKQRSPQHTIEKVSTPGLISRLTKLGLQIIQPGVIKKFEKLNDNEKMKLAQYLTTVESYAGSLRTSPYITSLKGIPYLALKFSYGTSAYRIICHKDTHEITDICEHDEYQKKYLIS